jgi:purine-binding chemotaxis protein CheW
MTPIAEILLFEVAGQRHGLPIAQVRELLAAAHVTPLPDAPPGVEGVIDLRGVIVPVVNVRQRLDLPDKPLAPSDHFIAACVDGKCVILHVDRALDLLQVEDAALATEGGGSMVKCDVGLVYVHDTRQFLTTGVTDPTTRALP